ncbi:MAG: CAP domain-containing protein [Isosphaeraceae bacterium]
MRLIVISLVCFFVTPLMAVSLAARVYKADDDAPEPVDSELVTALIAAHNRERAKADLPPLKANAMLKTAAKGHAKDMAEHETMTHEGSDKSTPDERVARADYHYQRVGENVAAGQRTVEEVMDSWMNSPPHKKNILGDFAEVGVARAADDDGTWYWCVDFGSAFPKLDPEEASKGLIDALNKARADAKQPALTLDPKLAEVAQRHAHDMAAAAKLAPKDSDGLTPFDRIQKQRLRYRSLGESDAAGQATGAEVVETWLDSAPHKQNVIGKFSRIGVGYAIAKNGTPYWSVIFGRPMPR